MNYLKTKLFGTSGIRGETNKEISPNLALELSIAFGTWLDDKGTVVLGRDTRFGAEMLIHAISAGLQSVGLDVLDCGVLPTPALSLKLQELKSVGGVMVTGSHMPPNRIGLIFLDSDACYLSDNKALEVENLYFQTSTKEIKNKIPTMNKIGTFNKIFDSSERYVEFVLSLIDKKKISELSINRDFKVVVDPGNGTAVEILPDLVEQCGLNVIAINNVKKGNPDRPAEPRASTLDGTRDCVKNNKAQLGTATDVDADRVVFINENCEVVSEDLIGAIFAKNMFENYAKQDKHGMICVTPVNSSGLIDYLANNYNVKMKYCKIGQPDTERALIEAGEKAVFAYEESGKYYFAKDVHWCDGNLATLVLLQIMAMRKKTLVELTDEFPKFYQTKSQFECTDDSKENVLRTLTKKFKCDKKLLQDQVMDITIDGLKRIYNDNSWLLLRPSGTEPLFRLYSDAMTQERADYLIVEAERIVSESIQENL